MFEREPKSSQTTQRLKGHGGFIPDSEQRPTGRADEPSKMPSIDDPIFVI